MQILIIALVGIGLSLSAVGSFGASITDAGAAGSPSVKTANTLCPQSRINNQVVGKTPATYTFNPNVQCNRDVPYSGGVWGAWTPGSVTIALVPLCPSDYPYLNYIHEKWGGTSSPPVAAGVVILWAECCTGPKTTMANSSTWTAVGSCVND